MSTHRRSCSRRVAGLTAALTTPLVMASIVGCGGPADDGPDPASTTGTPSSSAAGTAPPPTTTSTIDIDHDGGRIRPLERWCLSCYRRHRPSRRRAGRDR